MAPYIRARHFNSLLASLERFAPLENFAVKRALASFVDRKKIKTKHEETKKKKSKESQEKRKRLGEKISRFVPGGFNASVSVRLEIIH